jgi:hypothetical protein
MTVIFGNLLVSVLLLSFSHAYKIKIQNLQNMTIIDNYTKIRSYLKQQKILVQAVCYKFKTTHYYCDDENVIEFLISMECRCYNIANEFSEKNINFWKHFLCPEFEFE